MDENPSHMSHLGNFPPWTSKTKSENDTGHSLQSNDDDCTSVEAEQMSIFEKLEDVAGTSSISLEEMFCNKSTQSSHNSMKRKASKNLEDDLQELLTEELIPLTSNPCDSQAGCKSTVSAKSERINVENVESLAVFRNQSNVDQSPLRKRSKRSMISATSRTEDSDEEDGFSSVPGVLLRHIMNTNNHLNQISLRLRSIEKSIHELKRANSNSNTEIVSRPGADERKMQDGKRSNTVVLRRAKTDKELEEVLDKIKDYKAIARRIESSGLRGTIRKFVQLLMSKRLASEYSWAGFGHKRIRSKKSFRDHRIFVCLQDVLRHTRFSEATFQDLAKQTQNVFNGVPDWEGGRNKRLLAHSK